MDILEPKRQWHENGKRRRSQLYMCWGQIKTRCYSPGHKQWKDYGGKGVEFAEYWLDDFDLFWFDMHELGFAEGLTIDRIDSSGNYERGNIQWVTQPENSRRRIADKGGPRQKLAADDIPRIMDMLACGVKQKDIADWFGVNRATISDIKTGKTWPHITGVSKK